MGSGAKKKHESISVATAGTAASTNDANTAIAGTNADSLELGVVTQSGLAAIAKAEGLIQAFTTTVHPVTGYAGFAAGFGVAKAAVLEAQDEGAPAQIVKEELDTLKLASKTFLADLSVDQLEQIAEEGGFEHPGLIGLHTSPGKTHPLAYFIDPYYSVQHSNKETLQDKAIARWEVLKNGGEVEGYTLATYLAKYPQYAPEVEMDSPNLLNPEEMKALEEEIEALRSWIHGVYYYSTDVPANPSELANKKLDRLAAIHRYKNTLCTDPTYQKVATHPGGWTPTHTEYELLAERIETEFGVPLLDQQLLNYGQTTYAEGLTQLLFGPDHFKDITKKTLENRKAALEELKGHLKVTLGPLAPLFANEVHPSLALPAISTTSTASWAEVDSFLHHFNAQIKPLGKVQGMLGKSEVAKEVWGEAPTEEVQHALEAIRVQNVAKQTPAPFRQWAKKQSLYSLRALAKQVEESHGDVLPPHHVYQLPRAQLTNFILGHIDNKAKAKYENATQSETTPTKAAATVAATHPNAAQSAAQPNLSPSSLASKVMNGILLPKNATFAQKRSAMAEGLQALVAAKAAIPKRPSAQDVAELKFKPTAAVLSGGGHQKSFYVDDSGRTWMFKPDHEKGARVEAEVAAAEIFHRVGLPSVPVYRRNLEGKVGSIQPIVSQSGNIDPSPSSWSQVDVDSMVRYHVASWIVGDHDGKSDNMLRTQGGGLVAIDLGQAWKFVGRDKLDSNYHPNSSFGAMPPVHHLAYKAHIAGNLGAGVTIRPEAAAPIIDRFEKLPDDEFRTILKPVALEGAKSGLPWVAPMSAVAKKKFQVTNPTHEQIADAFIETLVERKKNLRKDFTSFFQNMGITGAQTLEQVA